MIYLFYLILVLISLRLCFKLYFIFLLKKILKFNNSKYIFYEDYLEQNFLMPKNLIRETIISKHVDEPMDYFVILPPNYDSNKKYPALIFLAGMGDSAISWLMYGKLFNVYNQLLEKNEIQDMILILPEPGHNGHSWYSNWRGRRDKRYETFFTTSLIEDLKDKYSINNNLGVTGFSMGGYGAFKLALKHPKVFNSVSSFAGAVNLPRLLLPELKGFGLLKHLKNKKNKNKSYAKNHFSTVFGEKIIYLREENVFNLLTNYCKKNRDDLLSKHFCLSVGDKDNKRYTMLYQWSDIVEVMEKYSLNYEARLVKNEYHSWSYVEKELPAILKFHSKHF